MLISILTMYNNYPDIFDSFRVPEGVDRQTVIDGICADCAELELLYSDPDALQVLVKNWTDRHFHVWEELQKTLEYDYNPIWNVEGSEKMVIDREDQEDRNLKDQRTPNLTETRTPDLNTTSKVAGYNSESLVNREQVSEAGSDTRKYTGSDVTAQTGNVKNKGKETRTFTRGMNLGVMTTQQLIREQRELVQFTMANYIISSFKDNFCLLIY